MKFSGHIDINKPVEEVVNFFTDSKNLAKWQDGFVKKELLEGNAWENGAVSKMYYQYGKRGMELTETIISNLLPHSFEASYHHKHMDNTMRSEFKPLGELATRYIYEVEYTRMSFVPKLMGILFPSMYRKQGEKWIKQFKEQIEKL
ncbi:SRPBCC family protein [Poritiphilus flavus]|uniref:Polyketide cyclase / dehydrase and lipid transport n=1 Tax=Poritiphilus flavus TaxID=2697053 RepID=A0A6L9EFW6_9FLAO|nr:SRPBCC family protein [Poritiphilus flavus]NAS13581.1 hypothetical protein [Poritiphilus flavus]